MTVGSVAIRMAASPVVFPAEIVIVYENDQDTSPTAYASLPRGRFNAPLFVCDGPNAKAAQAELEAFAERHAPKLFLDWYEKQTDVPDLTDPAIAVAALSGNGGKRGVKISKRK